MVNQFFGVNIEDNFNEYENIKTINTDVFKDYSDINWSAFGKIRTCGNLYSSDDQTRMDFCDFAKGVTGDYLPNTPQQAGDCVAAGFEVASEHLNLVEIWNGETQVFYQHYRPWLYGIGRVYGGKNKIRGDGSLMSWQVDAAAKYGILREDIPGLPRYSTKVAREWGSSKSVLDKWKDYAKDFLIKNSVQINNFDELCDAMIIGKMPVVIASSQGFKMDLKVDERANKSWFIPSGTWQHLMSILACDKGNYAGCRVHNQWGVNAHPDQLDGPDGTGWVTETFFNKWVKQRYCVCIAIGNFDAWTNLKTSPF